MEEDIRNNRIKGYGFIIDPGIIVDLENSTLVKYITQKGGKSFHCSITPLKKSTLLLFSFLLSYGMNGPISRKIILREAYGMNVTSSSQKKLWQVMNDLKSSLELVGAPENLIVDYPRKGVSVEYAYIRKLYVDQD